MKRLVTLFALFAATLAALAQPPEEILARMEEGLNKHDNSRIAMTIDIKFPILGTISTRTYMIGDKMRTDATMMGAKIITWSDGTTQWAYNDQENTLEIKNDNKKKTDSKKDGDVEMFEGISDGYDVSIKKETADEWYILCRKSRNNTDKDAPKTMDVVVAKSDYHPVSLSAKMAGMTMTMREISFDVTEQQVTFRREDYPGATVIDKR